MTEKDIRFTEKRVDQSWKQGVAQEKGGAPSGFEARGPVDFSAFLTSLGYQTLIHLGELPHPETKLKTADLTAAKETIDILMLLESKTKGNLTPEEERLFKALLPELQMKFAEKVRG